jgi:DNA-binding transcriptional regulator GbsR (MarR family)
MGSRWGLNRSVAQMHALLYLSPEPLHADEIAETLGVARSNVSVGLKELIGWNLVQVTQRLGDRRDFFVAQRDPWEVVRVIVEGRKRRELDPTVSFLQECAAALGGWHGVAP